MKVLLEDAVPLIHFKERERGGPQKQATERDAATQKLTASFRILFERNQIISLHTTLNGKFAQRVPQLRCTELQLKMRLADLHLQLNARLDVISRALPFEVAKGSPVNLNLGNFCETIST